MGFHVTDMQLNALFQTWQTNYHIYAPRNFSGGGRFSDTDCIRYGKIDRVDEIVFDKKSDYSFKEILTPISQTLFFFTEGETVQKASGADVNICSSCVFIYGQVTKSINCYILSTAAGGNNHYSRVLERDITCCPFYKHSGV